MVPYREGNVFATTLVMTQHPTIAAMLPYVVQRPRMAREEKRHLERLSRVTNILDHQVGVQRQMTLAEKAPPDLVMLRPAFVEKFKNVAGVAWNRSLRPPVTTPDREQMLVYAGDLPDFAMDNMEELALRYEAANTWYYTIHTNLDIPIEYCPVPQQYSPSHQRRLEQQAARARLQHFDPILVAWPECPRIIAGKKGAQVQSSNVGIVVAMWDMDKEEAAAS